MSTDVLAIVAIAIGAITRALGSDLPGFKSLSKPWRAVVVAGLGIAQGIVDMAAAGSPIGVAAVAVLKTTVPSLFMLVIEAIFGGDSSGGAVQVGGKVASIKPGAPAGPYSAKIVGGPWAKRWISRCVLVVVTFCAVTVTGCVGLGGLAPVLQDAILVAEDGQSILAALRAAFALFSTTNVLSDAQKKVAEQAFQDTSLALDAAVRALHGGKDITEDKVDLAFEDFRNAYTSLVALLRQLGAVHENATGALMARRGEKDVVLLPLAFQIKVAR